MTSIGSSFMFTILTNYSFYRYIIHRNAFFEKMTRIHFHLQIFFSFYAYVVIYSGSLVAREVNAQINIYKKYNFRVKILFFFFIEQGKKTSKILHNIINHCNDADVSSSVRKDFFFKIESNFIFSFWFSKQLAQVSLQILHRYPVASCGLFTFNWTLLYSVRARIFNINLKFQEHFKQIFG